MVNISEVINNQYPHFLYLRTSGGDAVQDENGSWIDAEPTARFVSACRDETGGRGSEINTAQAVFRDYTSLIQMPAGTEHLAEGTEIFVTGREVEAEDLLNDDFVEQAKLTGLVRISGIISKFDNGRLHNRAWI